VPFKEDMVSVACPKCGHTQPVPRAAYSGMCRKCQAHYRLADVLRETEKPAPRPFEQRHVTCFQCGTELGVSLAATSTLCKRCGSYVDLSDYQITQTTSKNFRTHGRLIVEEKGYLLNTDALVGDAIVKGRLIGRLAARRTLEIHSTAKITGSFTANQLVLPAGNQFRWPELLIVGGAEIAGELAAHLRSTGLILLKSTARLFGNVQAGNLVVESGAVFVGAASVGRS
jgi:cytoskeletal protein CcmA (bactofilin family)/predicted RNA-binding Zn-ribbon protein involved in translation (DUF1610 family)